MMWTPSKKISWINKETIGLLAEVKVIKGIAHWMLVDTETGIIIYSGKKNHPVEAMRIIQDHIDTVILSRKPIKGVVDVESNY